MIQSFRSFGIALSIAACLSSCVTVNVNFPESAVQKAADDYVKDLYRAKERGKNPIPSPSGSPSPAAEMAGRAPAWLLAEAHAEEAVFRVDSKEALKIRDELAGKLDDVLAQKRAGTVGETKDGMLSVRDADKLKPLLRKKVESLVAEENKIRARLYDEVLTLNKLPKNRLIDIQRSFARSFQKESPVGTPVEDPTGKWAVK